MQTSASLAALVALLTLAAAANSADPILALGVGGVLVFALALLWPTRGVPILLLPFGLQWLAVAMKPLQAALTGAPLNSLAERGADLTPAAWLGVAALAAMTLGMRAGAGATKAGSHDLLQREAQNLPARLVVTAALGAIFAGHCLDLSASRFGPAVQIALALSSIRLAGLFVLTFWCLSTRRQLPLLTGVVMFELVFGMTGFFSDFKSALLVILIAALAAEPRLRPSSLVAGAAACGLLLGAGVYWSAIKPDYRDFLNQGTGQQVVAQPLEDRLAYLSDAAGSFNEADFDAGLDALVRRQSYIDFLAHTMAYVPAAKPHENGARTMEAVTHVLTPRILFPDKPALPHDTIVTMRYTGLTFSNESLTSVSIGWVGDFFIDFGWSGTVLASFILGLVIGSIKRFLTLFAGAPLLANIAVAGAAMLPYIVFERPLVKLVGDGLMTFAAALILQRFVIPRVLAMLSPRSGSSAGDARAPTTRVHRRR
jgi:hypothetical protein